MRGGGRGDEEMRGKGGGGRGGREEEGEGEGRRRERGRHTAATHHNYLERPLHLNSDISSLCSPLSHRCTRTS